MTQLTWWLDLPISRDMSSGVSSSVSAAKSSFPHGLQKQGVSRIPEHNTQFGKLIRPGVSNSNCSVGHMRICEVTCGPHYDADTTIAVPELTRNSFFILYPAKGVINYR